MKVVFRSKVYLKFIDACAEFKSFLWTFPFDSILVIGHACFLKQLVFGDKPHRILGNCDGLLCKLKDGGSIKLLKEIKM